jgi:uncharacterized protein YbaP (TraB family)
MHRFFAGLVAAILTLAGQAQAQDSKREWSDAAEIQIHPHQSGPVLWKLTRGDSTIWVLGVLPAQFEDTRWDDTRLRRVMRGSRVMIIPAASTADDATIALAKASINLPAGQRLGDVLSPAAYERFRKTVEREDLSLVAYTGLRPQPAGNNLYTDVLAKTRLTTSMPEYIGHMAQKSKVPVRRAGHVDGSLLVRHMSNLDAAAGEACLVNYLDGIDYDENVFPKAVKAWGKGDIKTVIANYQDQPFLTCDLANPDSAAFIQSYAVDMMADALDAELATPGKAMAVVDISDLLRKDGVLDKLRARGIEVTSPDM